MPIFSHNSATKRPRFGVVLTAALGLGTLAAAGLTPLSVDQSQAAPAKSAPEVLPDTYRGQVEVVRGAAADEKKLQGSVFDDKNKNSVQDKGEKGIPGPGLQWP